MIKSRIRNTKHSEYKSNTKIKNELKADLNYMCEVFDDNDHLIKGTTFRTVYFIFIKELKGLYSIDDPKKIRMFLEDFEIQRKTNRERDDEDVDYKF